MARHNHKAAAEVAMGGRNACVGGHTNRAADAWNHHEWNVGGLTRLGFLAATSKHKGIATFEPHNQFALPRLFDHAGIDLSLRERVAFGLLSDVDQFRAWPGLRKQFGRRKTIIENHVGLLEN